MDLVVSPYHLSGLETPAMAALQLAERVVTILPRPDRLADAEELRDVARAAPRYHDLLARFEDLAPLWRSGVVLGEYAGESAMDDVREALRLVQADPRYEPLRRFVDVDRFAGDARSIQALSHDLLRAGPDPAVSVPMASGLDAFASRNGLVVARGPASSIAQRAELKLGTEHFSAAVPVIVQCELDVLHRAREALRAQRETLGLAIEAAFEHEGQNGVRKACAGFTEAFEAERAELSRSLHRDDISVRIETVSIRGVTLPVDAVLRSSLIAARSFTGPRPGTPSTALATSIASAMAPTRSLVIAPIVRRG